MKRLVCILLVLVMVLSLAGCGKEEPSRRPSDNEDETETKLETESTSETETNPQPEEETPPIPSTASEVLPLSVLLSNDCLVEFDENNDRLAYVEWDEVRLDDASTKAYPLLADALIYVNRSFRGWSDNNLVTLTEKAKNQAAQMDESFSGFEATNHIYVQRADSCVLSLLSQYILSDGQAMGPSYTYEGVNLDSSTGMTVTIDMVITDFDALPQILEEALTKKFKDYPEGAFSGMADKLKNYAPRDYKWTIGYQGVTFYFDEQELLTPHHGGLSVTLWFADHPSLFAEAYTQCPENGYASALPLNADVEVDLMSGDGKTDRLFLVHQQDESLQIDVNQAHYQESYFGYSAEAYLVTPDNRNFYLYIESHADSDYSTVHVYELKAGEVVPLTELGGLGFEGVWFGTYDNNGTYCDLVFNDPTHFTLYTYAYMLSTVHSSRSYHTDPKTGIPVADTDYYTMDPSLPPLISKIPLTVTMLPDNTSETLPAGTKFHFLRTDNETYVDMRLEDGRECRIEVVRQDWELYVDGHSEYDCFENLMYAG